MGKAIVTVFFMALLGTTICLSQEVETDIKGKSFLTGDSVPVNAILLEHPLSPSISSGNLFAPQPAFDASAFEVFDSVSRKVAPYRNVPIPGTAVFPMWKNSAFVATGSINSYPGLMEIHSGTVGFVQDYGKVSLYIGAEANKYGYFNGLHTQYGINGLIRYTVSPKLTLTGFATYYFGRPPLMSNGMMMPPSMTGYFGVSTFGGTAEYQFNETFGLIVGGEAVQQFGTNRYRFEPIVTPTFKIGKIKFGIPVGQMANDIIRSYIHEKRRR